jgi:hypothetical protein
MILFRKGQGVASSMDGERLVNMGFFIYVDNSQCVVIVFIFFRYSFVYLQMLCIIVISFLFSVAYVASLLLLLCCTNIFLDERILAFSTLCTRFHYDY